MRQSTADRRSDLYRDALGVLTSRFADERISVARVAREIATSTRQLQRAFAEAGGTTVRRELYRVRMERAAELLTDRSRPIKDVATAVGYRQSAQFAKAFRRYHGVSPSSFADHP